MPLHNQPCNVFQVEWVFPAGTTASFADLLDKVRIVILSVEAILFVEQTWHAASFCKVIEANVGHGGVVPRL